MTPDYRGDRKPRSRSDILTGVRGIWILDPFHCCVDFFTMTRPPAGLFATKFMSAPKEKQTCMSSQPSNGQPATLPSISPERPAFAAYHSSSACLSIAASGRQSKRFTREARLSLGLETR